MALNHATFCGRATKDPDIRYTQGSKPMCIAKYSLAVDRKIKKQGEQSADFIPVTAFGKAGEFVEKYVKKGTKLIVSGRFQSGSYTNKDGVKVFTLDLIAEEQEFAESKNASASGNAPVPSAPASSPASAPSIPSVDDFMNVAGGDVEELPFS
jgi:single-strand DNA-binding protein